MLLLSVWDGGGPHENNGDGCLIKGALMVPNACSYDQHNRRD